MKAGAKWVQGRKVWGAIARRNAGIFHDSEVPRRCQAMKTSQMQPMRLVQCSIQQTTKYFNLLQVAQGLISRSLFAWSLAEWGILTLYWVRFHKLRLDF